MIRTSLKHAADVAAIGFATALLAGAAFAQTPSTSTNKAVPEHGAASSKTPAMAKPVQPGAGKSGQPHLPPTASSKHEGSSNGTASSKTPAMAAPKVAGPAKSGQPHLPPTASSKHEGSSHGTASSKVPPNTGAAPSK
jgi:hypothetical protein